MFISITYSTYLCGGFVSLTSCSDYLFQGCASAEEYLEQLPQYDHYMSKKRQDAEDQGEVSFLRHYFCIKPLSKSFPILIHKSTGGYYKAYSEKQWLRNQ